jgi:predicted RNA-binding protein YlqC (UPF0109 family)
MKELLGALARAIVDHPEAVSVQEHEDDGTLVLELAVAPDDVGKVIGRQGRIIKAIRQVVKAAAAREGRRVAVEVV